VRAVLADVEATSAVKTFFAIGPLPAPQSSVGPTFEPEV
jgi:hypothetical protein